MLTPLRAELLETIRSKGLRRLDEPVKLASGAWSSDFVDGKEALAHWRDLRVAAEAIVEAVRDAGHRFDAAGGLTMGADALSVAVAAVADCRWFFVRKAPKQRGTRRWVEGAQIGPDDRVLLIDDVVTTGGSMLQAHEIISETGALVIAAATLVDRSGLAGPQLDALDVPYFAMATYDQLGIAPVRL